MKFDVTLGGVAVAWVGSYRHRNGLYSVVMQTPTVKHPAVVLGSTASSERRGLAFLVDLYPVNGEILIGTRPTRVTILPGNEPERRALCGQLVDISPGSWSVRLLAIPGGVLLDDEPVGSWDAAPFVDPLGRVD
jgi:hypothetical protein